MYKYIGELHIEKPTKYLWHISLVNASVLKDALNNRSERRSSSVLIEIAIEGETGELGRYPDPTSASEVRSPGRTEYSTSLSKV